jgi:undecaprenyl pyrophosphate phosphatase UppP
MKNKLKAIYKTVSSIIVITLGSVFFVITYYLVKLFNLIKKLFKIEKD